MGKRIAIVAAVLVAALTLSGCVTRLGSFSVISTKNIDWSRASEFKRSANRVEGTDILHIIVFIPTKFQITPAEAVDRALEKIPGSVALVDAVLSSTFFWIPYIYGNSGYVIEGSLLLDPALAALEPTSDYLAYMDAQGEVQVKEVSRQEYVSLQNTVKL